MPTVEFPESILEKIPLGWAYVKSKHEVQRPKHIELLSEFFYKIAHGIIKRGIVNMPPGYGKTFNLNWFLAWYFDQPEFVNNRVLLITYGADLAGESGRDVRNKVDKYGRFRLAEDSSAVGHWKIEGYAGGMYAIGLDGPATGKRPHLILVDDVCKDEDFNTSDIMDKYDHVIRDRLEPGGSILFVGHRWSVDDPYAELIKRGKEGGEEFEVLAIPARCDSEADPCGRKIGEPLQWPERFEAKGLNHSKELDALECTLLWMYNAKYQQQPLDKDKQTIDKAWFRIVTTLPPIVKVHSHWDMAVKNEKQMSARGKKRGDFAARAIKCMDDKKNFGTLEIKRVRKTPDGIDEVMQETLLSDFLIYGCTSLSFESDTGGTGEYAALTLARKLLEFAHKNGIMSMDISYSHPTGSKSARFMPVVGLAKLGKVWLYQGDWITQHLAYVEKFPNCEYDDTIDADSGAQEKLTETASTASAAEAMKRSAESNRASNSRPFASHDRPKLDFGI